MISIPQECIPGKLRFALVVFAILIAGQLLSSCSQQSVKVPQIEPAGQYTTGKFVWYDLYTDDLKSATRFYEGLFGWSFQNTQFWNNNVKTISLNGVPIANAVLTTPLKKEVKESRWLGFISVIDVDKATKVIEQNKGSIYISPRNVSDRGGRVAVAIDPEGAIFAIIRATNGDPADTNALENSWLGSELWTTNPESALSFYGRIAGYEKQMVGVGTDSEYLLLVTDNQPRAGIVKISWENIKPDWLPYIGVSDVAALVKKAEELGGHILVEPDTSVFEGLVSIIADPTGAVFAIQEMPKADKGGE